MAPLQFAPEIAELPLEFVPKIAEPPAVSIKNLGTFWVINQSDISNADVEAMINLQQLQIDREFAPKWGVTATLERTDSPSTSGFNIYIKNDNSDIGTNDFKNTYIFKDSRWQLSFSHKILEMLANPKPALYPLGNWSDEVEFAGKTGRFALEVCDPVADLAYNEGMLSNFVYPSWFVPGSLPPWDRLNILTGPLTFTPWGNQLFRESGFIPLYWIATNNTLSATYSYG